MFTTVEIALEELKKGKAIIVVDDESRENEGDFVALADYATPDMINFMAKEGRGLICTPIEQQMADRLGLAPMTNTNTDVHGTAFTVSIDHSSCHTGISAFERSETILKMIDRDSKSSDFRRPGHIFPLVAKSGGVLERPGHTEAAVDLARLAGMTPAGVICEIMNDDGTMARGQKLLEIAKQHELVILTIKQLIAYRKRIETLVEKVVTIHLPTSYGDFTATTYVEKLTGQEHIALVKGQISETESPIVRIHSECLTGDVFGSCRCDCGPQLQAALAQIEEAGTGVLVYMRQEGRGIGLVNKMKAYKLQEQGYDTVEANTRLGFGDDLREYFISAQILSDLGCTRIQLLTNNPRKIEGLSEHGITIENRIPIELPAKDGNRFYMETKRTKLGHLLHN
ncbi:bifunctional 3,4-dihydroxy-2-butanone-4-phosphate synthase/GTP cyclohydrolase II [Sporosarcina luteola]|uniref:bifunctional 3,4-dihydroxy-2-butanone-4-phosphate synthase/GTP cyclohydrolase II n=1 Tax=Bacillales TaxID=1385 RepID=UPI00203EED05|nr:MULTISPECIES: bifunctional 3,4-dihydroxy-2-butanone-4-phosphate synthase/GTP cyclohydrolase II [Bacillales]MCM3637597.1 bifunctional 3,4-dihydroxy-2-butanone-4-phosphate synthase/GTP cyclohydrolase II [Sporosarcina luteola]